MSGNAVVLPSGSFAANPNSWSLDWDSSGDNTRHQVSNLDTAPLSNDEAIPLGHAIHHSKDQTGRLPNLVIDGGRHRER